MNWYKITIETPITLSKYTELVSLIRKHFGSNVTLERADGGYAVKDAGPIKPPHSSLLGFAWYEAA